MSEHGKRRPFIGPVALLGLVVVAVGAAVVAVDPFHWMAPDPDLATGDPTRAATSALVQDLESSHEAESGAIVHVGLMSVTDPQPGVIGWIVEAEQSVEAGDVLYQRDDHPVVLLYGSVPAWRTMTVDDVGPDVAQLEANLVALGYGTEDEFTVDDVFTSATAVIVQRWQADLGVIESGVVAHGDVVFGPAPSRVGEVFAAVGDSSAGATLFTLSAEYRQIEFTVAAHSVDALAVGSEVSARLPDRSTVTGVVEAIAPADPGFFTVTAGLPGNGNSAGGGVDGRDDDGLPQGDSVPVTVTWTDVVVVEAVTVPASALLRLDSGHYAVEVVGDDGRSEPTIVQLGEKVGSRIQVVSGLTADDQVIAP